MNNNNFDYGTMYEERAKRYVDLMLYMAEHKDELANCVITSQFLDIILDLMRIDLEIMWGDYPLPEDMFYEILFIYLCEKLGLDDGEGDETHE